MIQNTRYDEDEVREHREWARRLALRLGQDPALADDVAQEAMVALLRSPPASRDATKGWLRSVVRRMVSNSFRSRSRRRRREERAARDEFTTDSTEAVERADAIRALLEEADALPETLREAVRLTSQGHALGEVAEQLGVPYETARSRVRRGLDRLRTQMDKRFGGSRTAWLPPLLALRRSPEPQTEAPPRTRGPGRKTTAGVIAAAILIGALVWSAAGSSASDPTGREPADKDAATAADPSRTKTRVERERSEKSDPGAEPAVESADPTAVADAPVEKPDQAAATYAITGTVRGPEGRIPTGIAVEFVQSKPNGNYVRAPCGVDREGRFRLEGIPAELDRPTFWLRAGADGFVATEYEFERAKSGRTVEVRLEPTWKLSGRVVNSAGEPVPEVLVVNYHGPVSSARAHSSADGTFTFEVPEHTVKIAKRFWLTAPGGAPARTSSKVTAIDKEARTATLRDLVARRTGTVRGRLFNADGTPRPNAKAILRSHDMDSRVVARAETDERGAFVFERIAEGRLMVESWWPVGEGEESVVHGAYQDRVVIDGEAVALIGRRAHRVVVRFLDEETGEPLVDPRARIRIGRAGGATDEMVQRMKSIDGKMEVRVHEAALYDLQVSTYKRQKVTLRSVAIEADVVLDVRLRPLVPKTETPVR